MIQRNITAPVFLFFIYLLFAGNAIAQGNPAYSSAIEEKIKQVENNLSGHLHIQDSVNTWSLQPRMKESGINGVSIAVLHNYKLEWTRGYGHG